MWETIRKGSWEKYGLCIIRPDLLIPLKFEEAIKNHDLIADYLDKNPDVEWKDKFGFIRYYEILKMAEEVV